MKRMMQENNNHRITPVIAWAFYDWAASSFSVIILTFVFATYFTKSIAVNEIVGTAQWGHAIAIAGIIVAILSPIFGAIADYEGRCKPWLAFFTILCIVATSLLWFAEPSPNYIYFALTFVVLGAIGQEVAQVFYNSMLSDIAPRKYIGRYSGWGWGFGYFGGIVCLLISLFVFIEGKIPWVNLNHATAEHVRIVGPFVAGWYLLFGWLIFAFTPDRSSTGHGVLKALRIGLKVLGQTLKKLFHNDHREILKFLLARMIYMDGLNTIFAFGGIYAAGTFGMSFAEVIQFAIAMNICAGLGCIAFAWLDDYRGSKLTILIALAIMIVAGTALLFIHSKTQFWIFGMMLSLGVGPIQSASRSLMIRLAPKELITEMFGLFALSGRVTAFIGPWILAYVTLTFASQRAGMGTTLVFLLVGAIGLLFVRPKFDSQ